MTQVHLFENRNRADSFGEDAEQYDRVRPNYPATMIDFLLQDERTRVLDVGCGTGIASRLFLARGCEVLGLEPDPRMAEVARRYGQQVEIGTIEEFDPAGRVFDLLTAGQSWHWVNPPLGAAKASQVLRPGGRIGLFWNQANAGVEVRDAIVGAYERHAPELGRNSVLLGMRGYELYELLGESLRVDDLFHDVSVETFNHHQTYSTDQWLELTTTHSDHRTLPAEQLSALLADLGSAINAVGGEVPVRYETTLVTGLRT
jgi:SAM-dependent methyltransferase